MSPQVLTRIEVDSVFLSVSYLLGTGLLQWHPQAAGVFLVVGDEFAECGEGDLVWDEVRANGGALDPEVVHFPLTAGCRTERRATVTKCEAEINTAVISPWKSGYSICIFRKKNRFRARERTGTVTNIIMIIRFHSLYIKMGIRNDVYP